jgi:large subunit ribosomal protein L6
MRINCRNLLIFCFFPLVSMSRIWKLPVELLEGVSYTYDATSRKIEVTGPKGALQRVIPEWVLLNEENNHIVFSLEEWWVKAMRGLARSLVSNMIIGVHTWYEKKLQVIGVWYNAKVQWNVLVLNLGYSHSVNHDLPKEVTATVDKDPKWNDMVILQSIDKQLLWEQAAKIRSYRKPEPYKWKWVRYLWEYIKMKAGKTAAKK